MLMKLTQGRVRGLRSNTLEASKVIADHEILLFAKKFWGCDSVIYLLCNFRKYRKRKRERYELIALQKITEAGTFFLHLFSKEHQWQIGE